MADRFPLILNTSNNQIQEIASGDQLDLTGSGISNAGIITAGNVTIGAATTDLVVTGDARITGILTVGTSSLKLDGLNNLVNVGTALTLGHTQGLQFHTQNLHSAGFEVNQVNASGIITATGADINGDIDVDGHTNLDNISVAGVSTFAGNADFSAGIDVTGDITATGNFGAASVNITDNSPSLIFTDSANDSDFRLRVQSGVLKIRDDTNSANRLEINSSGVVTIPGNVDINSGLDVTGNATVSGNLSVGGVLTYEDVTNVDSVGIVTAGQGLRVSSGGINVTSGVSYFNANIVGTATTAISITTTDESSDTSCNVLFATAATGNLAPKTGTNLTFNSSSGALTATSFAGDGSNITNVNAATLDNIDHSQFLRSDAADTATGRITFSGNATSNHDDMASGTGSLGGIEVYNSASGNDAFMAFHTGSDYALYFGLDADSNSLAVGGWSMGAVKHKIIHQGNVGSGDALSGVNVYANQFHAAGGAGAVSIAGGSDIRLTNGDWTGNSAAKIQHHNNYLYITTGTSGLYIRDENTNNWWVFDTNGHFKPTNDSALDIGASGTRVRNLYVDDITVTGTVATAGASISNGAGALSIGGGSDIRLSSGGWTGNAYGKIQNHNQSLYICGGSTSNYSIIFRTDAADKIYMKDDGTFYPTTNNQSDLGTSSLRWRNIYTNDLNLSNKDGANDVDGTWGDYTIQEGESELFLINNRSGKKYKFNLTEVS